MNNQAIDDENRQREPHPDSSAMDNCPVDPEVVREEKVRRDALFEKELNRLIQEKQELERQYQVRIEELQTGDHYKADLFQAQIAQLNESKAKDEEFFRSRMAHFHEDRQQYEQMYQDKLAELQAHETQKDQLQEERQRQLARELMERDQAIQAKIDQLNAERQELAAMYKEKAIQLQQDQSYKQDVLQIRTQLQTDKETYDKEYQERLQQLEQDKENQNGVYADKLVLLQRELEGAGLQLQEKTDQILREKAAQQALIEDRISQLEEDKRQQDEIFRLQLEKIEQDRRYQEQLAQLQQTASLQDQMHIQRQEELRRERERLETSYRASQQEEQIRGLCRLSEMKEYEVADGNADVRGWVVMDGSGERIGKVDELIVDTNAMKVRYLEVAVDRRILDRTQSHQVLIPIGAAELTTKEDQVWVPGLNQALISKYPVYEGQPLTREYEHTLLAALSPDYAAEGNKPDEFYNHAHFDESRFYNSKRSPGGNTAYISD